MRKVDPAGVESLLNLLFDRGYRVIGPTLRDEAIVYDELHSIADLPRGITDIQDGGQYRIRKREDNAYFGYNAGPHSWKHFLFQARERLWRAERQGSSFHVIPEELEDRKLAFLGVRSCDLEAIRIQDKIFLKGRAEDRAYAQRRKNCLIIVVQCTQAGGTCFCVSMGTGPRAREGAYDLALTEVVGAGEHFLLCDAGSAAGEELLSQLSSSPADDQDRRRADDRLEAASQSMGRKLNTDQIKDLLYQNFEHPRWNEVAQRCLSCGNCTLVCPTCFCSTFEDVTDLTGDHTERWRRWDSCFNLDHSYLHGGSVRGSVQSRYRQWMTHKLASWIDQFGESGCVGCGRCITWCPVGIDITEESAAIRAERSP